MAQSETSHVQSPIQDVQDVSPYGVKNYIPLHCKVGMKVPIIDPKVSLLGDINVLICT